MEAVDRNEGTQTTRQILNLRDDITGLLSRRKAPIIARAAAAVGRCLAGRASCELMVDFLRGCKEGEKVGMLGVGGGGQEQIPAIN